MLPEDLAPDSTGDEEPEFREEEVVSERIVVPGPLKLAAQPPRSAHLFASGGIEVEDRTAQLAHAGNGGGATAAGSERMVAEMQRSEQVRVAKLQGYEGDACPSCASFTLVRNGSCLKCLSCGGTTGCS